MFDSSAGPIIVATPPKPSSTPAILRGLMRSSWVRKWATSTPQIGVVALRIEARPLAMCVWPQPNRAKGMALLSKARSRIDPHTCFGRPTLWPLTRRTSHIAAAAMVRRSHT